MFTLLKTEGHARRGVLTCAHGTAQTPVFMNVGTQGAIKGAVSALRPEGDRLPDRTVQHLPPPPSARGRRGAGDGRTPPVSCAGTAPSSPTAAGSRCSPWPGLPEDQEEGVTFASHIDGRRIFMGPEESMQIQSNLGSATSPWPLTNAWKTPPPMTTSRPSCAAHPTLAGPVQSGARPSEPAARLL